MTDVWLDPGSGAVTVLLPDGACRLRTPTCAEWARWYDALADLDFADQAATARLNILILRTLGCPLPTDVDVWPLWVADPTVTSELIVHWRDRPISPFTAGTGDRAEPTGPSLPPGMAALHSLYAACAQIMSPTEIDACTLTQIAGMASKDRGDDGAAPDRGGRYSTHREPRPDRRHMVDRRAPGTPFRYKGTGVRALPPRQPG